MWLSKLLPLVFSWITFFCIYIFIPNTRVRAKSALIAGIFTGSLYLGVQYLYMYLQTMLTGYNAIYGSFAALPFFLIWLQASWIIILLGAQLAFAVQNVNVYELEPEDMPHSHHYEDVVAIRIMHKLSKAFAAHSGPCRVDDISSSLEIPIRTARRVLDELVRVGLVAQLQSEKTEEDRFLLAVPVEEVTPFFVLCKLNDLGVMGYSTVESRRFDSIFTSLWNRMESDPANKRLIDVD